MNNNNMNKMVLAEIHILLPFNLILTKGPKIIAKAHLRVVLGWRMLLKMGFRCMFY